MTDKRAESSARRSERLNRFSSPKNSKKGSSHKNSNNSTQLNTKRQYSNKKRISVEVDSLLSVGILPAVFVSKPTCKSQRRKDVSPEPCDQSFTNKKKSLRSSKKICSDLGTKEQAQNHTRSVAKNNSKKKRKLSLNVPVPRVPSSNESDSAVLLNSFSENDCSVVLHSIPLDDLLFVSSSRKKKSKDITLSSGICSAHSSITSSYNTPIRNSKCDSLKDISSNNVTGTNELFKVPKNKRPRKNTLKHKRLILSELNKNNLDHEDDILENMHLTPFKTVRDADEESEISWNMATPKCGFKLSPFLPKKTPVFKDCISPTELRLARKKAEEYMFRNNKLKKRCSSPKLADKKEPAKKIDMAEILSTFSQKRKNTDSCSGDELSSDEERDDDYYAEEESIPNY